MMMVPPATISLVLKLMLFVLVDGWNLVAGSILRSYS
jgi:flagellar biosynthetic protein FliP